MLSVGITASIFSFIISAIKSSITQSSLTNGKSIHAHSIKTGFFQETLICNHLLHMYSKCRSIYDARKLFDEMPDKNLISYSTLIAANSRSDDPILALHLTAQLQRLNLALNQFVFSSSVVACSELKSLILGEQIHAQAIVSGFESDPFVNTTLIDMYSKLGDPESSIKVFGRCPVGDPVMCNSMVSGYVSFGAYEEAFRVFGESMRDFRFKPTEFSFGSLIKAGSELGSEVGMQIHGLIVKTGFDSNCFIGSSLIDMYSRLGEIRNLAMVFSSILYVDIALYNAMIVGYSKNNLDRIALEYFSKPRLEGLSPNECTYSSALKSCAGLKSFDLGRMIHGIVEKSRFRQNLVVNTALIDMYMKCGKINESCRMFDSMHERNTILYNSMISGHGQNGNFIEALNLFVNMKRQHIDADLATFIALVTSCLGQEMSVFVHAIKHGFGSDLMLRNAILDGLFVRGAIKEALEFFNKMEKRDVISWTTIVSGLTQLGLHADAIEFFKKMSSSAAVQPNSYTFSSIFKACGSLAGLERGRCIHGCGIKHGIMDEFTNSSLLDMYSKCGALEESKKLFDKLASKDIVLWNTMIAGYAQHGYGHEALKLYTMMGRLDVEPNNVTFVSLLSACNHCGLVEDGVQLFEAMSLKHGVVPCMEHYACMVDMFGRAGMLDRAKNFIDDMPLAADASVWTVFLAACKLNSNVQLATLAKDHVMGIRGEDNPTVVAFSNMYSQIGRWEDAEKIRQRMGEGRIRKEPGLSSLQIIKKVPLMH